MFLLILSQFEIIDTHERKPDVQQPKKYLTFEASHSWCSSKYEQSNSEAKTMTKIASRRTESEQTRCDGDGLCPDCGATLVFQEGCASCQFCGYAVCNGGGR